MPCPPRCNAPSVAYLALAREHSATKDQLVDALWSTPPGRATNIIQQYVSALRRTLGASTIVTTGQGYQLVVAPENVDTHAFRRLVDRADEARNAGHPAHAATLLTEALALHRGEPLSGMPDSPFVEPAQASLQRALLEARIRATTVQNDLGRYASAIEMSETLAAEHPLDETVAAELMRALTGTGRQADALAVYDRVRALLVEELGLEPGLLLRKAQAAVLQQDGAFVALDDTPEVTEPTTFLPAPPTTTFGREADIESVLADLAGGARLLTLTGPGGIGKTRLAVEVARATVDRQGGPVDFVDLSAVLDHRLVTTRIADQLEPRREAGSDPGQVVATRYRNGGLLVLDNLEQVLAAANDVSGLLDQAPSLRVVVTSRSALQVRMETVHPLGALATDHQPGAARSPAVAMFHDRTDARRGSRPWSEAEELAAREVVSLVDGLPLAIELAAARCRLLGPRALASRLRASMTLLGDGPADLPARQRSMRQTIQWSVDLLEPGQRRALGMLGVFRGGFDVPALLSVLDLDESSALATVETLADASLIRVGEDQDGEPQFSLLQVIKAHTPTLLSAAELDAARGRHADWMVDLARAAQPHLRSEQSASWLARLDRQREDIAAAVHALREFGRVDDAADLVDTLLRYWIASPGSPEGRILVEGLLREDSLSPSSRGSLLLLLARLHERCGEYAAAVELALGAAEVARLAGNPNAQGRAYSTVASSTLWFGKPDESESFWEQALGLTEAGDDLGFRVLMLGNLGLLALHRCDYARALEIYEEALVHLRELGVVDGANGHAHEPGVGTPRPGPARTRPRVPA